MEFYLYLNGVHRGPFSEEAVQSALRQGVILPTDLAARDATGDWKPLVTFRQFDLISSESQTNPTTPAPAPARPQQLDAPALRLGPYARNTLSPNETPVYQTSLHWSIFIRFAFAGAVLFICAAVPFAIAVQALTGSQLGWFVLPLPAFLLVPPAVAFASSEILITDRRVLIKSGIIRQQTAEIFLSKVESIGVDRGVFGRIFDFGSVRIRGTGGFEESFDSIARPLTFRNWVQRLQSGERPRDEATD